MDAEPISEEKRAEIAKRSLNDFRRYVFTIPLATRSQIFARFKPMPGFRKGSDRDINSRLVGIFLDLSRSGQASYSAWSFYDAIRSAWLSTHKELDSVLEKSQEEYDQRSLGKDDPSVMGRDAYVFAALAKASQEGKITREELQLLYDWDYYPKNPEIEKAISSALTASEIATQKNKEEEAAKKHQEYIDHRLSPIEQELALRQQDDEKLSKNLTRQEGAIKTLEDSSTSQFRELRKSIQQKADAAELKRDREAITSIDLRVSESTNTIASLRKHVETLVSLNAFSKLRKEFDVLSGDLKTFNNQQNKTNQSLDRIEGESVQLLRDVSDQLSTLQRRLDALQQVPPPPNKTPEMGAIPSDSNIPRVILDTLSPIATQGDVPHQWGLVSHLTANFQRLGLSLQSARKLAREVAAGLAAGQMVTFSGSLAGQCAARSAACLAPLHRVVLRIPVGLLSGAEFGTLFDEAYLRLQDLEVPGAILLEGLNRSALEVYAERLHKAVLERLFNRHYNLPLLFGTLVNGPAALPSSSMLCELGPILQTDAQNWPPTSFDGGCTAYDVPVTTWHDQTTKRCDDVREEIDTLCNVIGGGTVLWRRCVAAACSHLIELPEQEKPPTNLQSVAFGWIFPYAIAHGVALDTVQNALTQHTVDLDARFGSYSKDDRIKWLLSVDGSPDRAL